HERRRNDRVTFRGERLIGRAVEVVREVRIPLGDFEAQVPRTLCGAESGDETRWIAIHHEERIPRGGPRGGGTAQLSHVVAAIAAAAHDDHGAELETLARDSRAPLRSGCV